MAPLLSTLLLVATTSAQLTTTFWQPSLGTDKIGFVGSIIAANDTHTTVVLDFDAAVDQSALHLGGYPATFIIGPNVYEESYDNFAGRATSASDAGLYRLHCENGTGNRTCTASFGAAAGYQQWCPRTAANQLSTTETLVVTHSYSARLSYSGGVETVTESFTFLPNTRTPASWCSESGVEKPYVTAVEMPKESFMTYQLVITAGVEKLNATQGGSASFTSATSTGSQTISGSSSRSSAASQTANAAPLATALPAVIGLGAAAAAILL